MYFWQARFVAKHGRTKGANGCPLRRGLLDLQCAVTVSSKAHSHAYVQSTCLHLLCLKVEILSQKYHQLRARLKKKKKMVLNGHEPYPYHCNSSPILIPSTLFFCCSNPPSFCTLLHKSCSLTCSITLISSTSN